mmetsp:Transcript_18207/g.47375  ORF Transcript_18207/g.47375 Transcript_18207/m.47375 type:complete len:113 (+) Transcript_18207:31-369(+)
MLRPAPPETLRGPEEGPVRKLSAVSRRLEEECSCGSVCESAGLSAWRSGPYGLPGLAIPTGLLVAEPTGLPAPRREPDGGGSRRAEGKSDKLPEELVCKADWEPHGLFACLL